MDKESSKNPKKSHEEFFRLPRAEFLIEEIRENSGRNIGDLTINPSQQLSGRMTMQIDDDTMEGAEIQAGDYAVIKRQSSYQQGSILAVQLGNRKLIRRYFRTAGRIHLECDPFSNQTIIVEDQTPDFQILGQVIQVVREIK